MEQLFKTKDHAKAETQERRRIIEDIANKKKDQYFEDNFEAFLEDMKTMILNKIALGEYSMGFDLASTSDLPLAIEAAKYFENLGYAAKIAYDQTLSGNCPMLLVSWS